MESPEVEASGHDREPAQAKGQESAAPTFPLLAQAVVDALRESADNPEPLGVARGCGALLEALHQQVLIVQARRDAALLEVLRSPLSVSHYALARELGVSRQRVDQLAARVGAARTAQAGNEGS